MFCPTIILCHYLRPGVIITRLSRRRNRALKLGNSYCLYDQSTNGKLYEFFSVYLKEEMYTSDSSNLGIIAIVKVYFGVNCLVMHIIDRTQLYVNNRSAALLILNYTIYYNTLIPS